MNAVIIQRTIPFLKHCAHKFETVQTFCANKGMMEINQSSMYTDKYKFNSTLYMHGIFSDKFTFRKNMYKMSSRQSVSKRKMCVQCTWYT